MVKVYFETTSTAELVAVFDNNNQLKANTMKTNIKSRIILGGCYAPGRFIREHKSVVLSGYFCTSSSAGDWTGYFVQKFGGKYGLFMFSQENRWPSGGYDLYVDEKAIGFYLEKPNKETVEQFIIDYFEL